ncbi:hypothetical protein VOLCADRAFT_93897 [Volvox carteri f. nagariensis]|uniref:Uncharacterized protein n=1 Tax=Volvox carteri f. nagariensis TaxID=3068 RepID=D8U3C9_VOLCA|nr:uncharacterized protein VOLCADRAFT_93897 [Volvox carteri f. nagariensis]EFJ45730.1 hypothetical protein VOLCADRAFT_93897 [Volvox carteri f. nagariensis]|eukprot:XP_002953131.1 hypothetical protein VOLCADRAFT_93897 [Volvox carteri f. nagariensis]
MGHLRDPRRRRLAEAEAALPWAVQHGSALTGDNLITPTTTITTYRSSRYHPGAALMRLRPLRQAPLPVPAALTLTARRTRQRRQRPNHSRGAREQERERTQMPQHPPQDSPALGGSRADLGAEHVAAAAMAAGFPADGMPYSGGCGNSTTIAAGGQPSRMGGGEGSALNRQMSYSSRDPPFNGGVGGGGGGGGAGAVDAMQVDSSSSPPTAPLRTVSGMAEAAVTAAAAAAAAAAGAANAAAPAGDERIHASLAAIERKLLLQEERLVYELKQVRLMQKLLHVQQMKQMVREAMRGKDRDAAAALAAAVAGLGTEALLGTAGSPFPSAVAAAVAPVAATAGPDGVDGALARLSSLPSHVLVAAARAAAAAAPGGGGSGTLVRELSGTDVLRTGSGAAAAAAAHHGVPSAAAAATAGTASDHPHPPHFPPQQHPAHHHPLARHSSLPSHQRRGVHPAEVHGAVAAAAAAVQDGTAATSDEAWSSLSADGGGRLMAYIAALSSNKGAAPAGGLAATPCRDAGSLGVSDLGGMLGGGGSQASRQRAHAGGGGGSDGAGAAALRNGPPPLPHGSRAAAGTVPYNGGVGIDVTGQRVVVYGTILESECAELDFVGSGQKIKIWNR